MRRMTAGWHEGLNLCQEMIDVCEDPHVALFHNPRDRQFAIKLMDDEPYLYLDENGNLVDDWQRYNIDFCPWSGRALPERIGDQYFAAVAEYLGQDEDDIEWLLLDRYSLAREYWDHMWWRKRGIPIKPVTSDPDWEKPEPHQTGWIKIRAYDPPPGFRRQEALAPHLCTGLFKMLEDVRIMIAYLPQTREYGVRVLEILKPVNFQPIRIKPIRYCPQCGEELPAPLRGEWLNRLKAEGLTPDDPCMPGNLPSYWATDQWWREEGL